MHEDHFTIADLKALLTRSAGVAESDLDREPSTTLAALGVDSLAFLALQTALMDRYRFELPDEYGVHDSLQTLAAAVDQRLRPMPAQHADAS
jgi:acyl carrier protein